MYDEQTRDHYSVDQQSTQLSRDRTLDEGKTIGQLDLCLPVTLYITRTSMSVANSRTALSRWSRLSLAVRPTASMEPTLALASAITAARELMRSTWAPATVNVCLNFSSFSRNVAKISGQLFGLTKDHLPMASARWVLTQFAHEIEKRINTLTDGI